MSKHIKKPAPVTAAELKAGVYDSPYARRHFKPQGWKDVPSVTYAKEAKKGTQRKPIELTPGQYAERLKKWMTAKEAAVVLGCCPSAARVALKHVRHEYVSINHGGKVERVGNIYHRSGVAKLLAKRPDVAAGPPENGVGAVEACRILKCGRSTLHRYEQAGLIFSVRRRIRGDRGFRNLVFYPLAILEILKIYTQESRALRDDFAAKANTIKALYNTCKQNIQNMNTLTSSPGSQSGAGLPSGAVQQSSVA